MKNRLDAHLLRDGFVCPIARSTDPGLQCRRSDYQQPRPVCYVSAQNEEVNGELHLFVVGPEFDAV